MEDHIRRVFYAEVERQSAFGLIAIGDLTAALFAQSSSPARRDTAVAVGATDRIWYSVQALLIALGNVSKLLWPAKAHAARGAALRQDLDVADASVLGARTFRNPFDHFGESLDVTKFMRHLDTKNLAITVQGDSYALQPIAAALVQLQERARVLVEVPSWPPSALAAS